MKESSGKGRVTIVGEQNIDSERKGAPSRMDLPGCLAESCVGHRLGPFRRQGCTGIDLYCLPFLATVKWLERSPVSVIALVYES